MIDRKFAWGFLWLVAVLAGLTCFNESVVGQPAAVPAELQASMEAINQKSVTDTVSFLASDEMAGRDTPSPELTLASEYVAKRFEEAGLEGQPKEAKAEKDSAVELAKAEIERAKGVAEANQIIGDSLKGNSDYLRYLWIEGLHDDSAEVIYVPTEAGLPILEASRLR